MPMITHDADLPVAAQDLWAILYDFAGFLNWAAGGPDGGATI